MFDQYGNDIEDTEADFYEETDGDIFPSLFSPQLDIPVIYIEKQNASWTSAEFRIEVERLRNLHDIDVAKDPERVLKRIIEKARRERIRHPNWSVDTTAEDHPEWFKGCNLLFILIITNLILLKASLFESGQMHGLLNRWTSQLDLRNTTG